MSETQLKHVDPYSVNVDDMNERTENLNLGELEKSVSEQGLIQPPLVRKRNGDHEVQYSVVVGQRRVMAAQGAGVDSIPVVVVDWDDAEALEKSISENIDTFCEDVSKKDRAKAIDRLKELRGWTNSDVANKLGVDNSTIGSWVEWVREEWEGTSIHADGKGNNNRNSPKLNTDQEPPDKTVETARKLTGGKEEGEKTVEAMENAGVRETKDVKEVEERVKNRHGDDPTPSDIEDVALEVAAEKQGGDDDARAYIDFTATGNLAEAIENAGEDRGLSNREVVRSATTQWLESEGYL